MVDDLACPTCGHHNESESNFCSVCGADLGEQSVAVDDATASIPAIVDDGTPADDGSLALVITRGANAGSRYVIGGQTSIGRHPDSDVFLDDVTVSRRHAEIRRTAAGLEITDAGSLNGTYVNGERVDRAPLAEADQVQIGKYRMVLVTAEAS